MTAHAKIFPARANFAEAINEALADIQDVHPDCRLYTDGERMAWLKPENAKSNWLRAGHIAPCGRAVA